MLGKPATVSLPAHIASILRGPVCFKVSRPSCARFSLCFSEAEPAAPGRAPLLHKIQF